MPHTPITLSPNFSSWNHSIGSQINVLRHDLNNHNPNFNEVDLSMFRFSPPLLAIHFATKISQQTDNLGPLIISNTNSYLETIRFPFGINPLEQLDWEEILNSFTRRSYLPIIKFPIDHSVQSTGLREAIIGHTLKSIRSITGIPTNYFTGINYLVSELTDNLVDHSRADFGYLSFQFYPSRGIIDVCICDKGIGVLEAYQTYTGEKDFSQIITHVDAVQAAIEGHSTKNIPERGFGIASSRTILTDGLQGRFVFISGNALLVDKAVMDFKAHFAGTIALIRIPLQTISEKFNVFDYTG